MTVYSRRQLLGITGGAALAAAVGLDPAGAYAADIPLASGPDTATPAAVPPPAPVPIDLSVAFDNDAVATAAAMDGNFDGSGYTYPGEELPTGAATVAGTPFRMGSYAAGTANNVVALGQRIALPHGRYVSLSVLTSAGYGPASGTATISYSDGSTSTATLTGTDWYSGSGVISAPYRYKPDGTKDAHAVAIGLTEVWVDPSRTAVAITLPKLSAPAENTASLHVWAMTAQPVAVGRSIRILDVHSTGVMTHDAGPQSIEATVMNVGTVWLTHTSPARVGVEVAGARTSEPATVRSLAPGEQARVRIGIVNTRHTPAGTVATGTVRASIGKRTLGTAAGDLTLGIPDFTPSLESLQSHQSPYWFDDAKFGIFIHWGVYSVPGWAPVGKQYAEWYWNQMNDPTNPTYTYHRQTYGEDFDYDDFIPMFTAKRWNPESWVKLFESAGAEYFVLTSKHHEGFCLWDCAVSDRNSVKMGPHRDIVRDLFDASKAHAPALKRGLYFSLPEWYNPDHPWEGHGPRNPYTGASLPYTGYTPGKDFIDDYQSQQVLELVERYDPRVLWFDIGGDNDSLHTLPQYLNHAKNRKRPIDVVYNNRDGIDAYDFTTPEYTTYADTVTPKWEASRGLDPNSYGINRQTPDSAYLSVEESVQSLVDIVSKNGNFLLDIGPDFDGTVPAVMQQRLQGIGRWLKANGESIYGSTYWSRMAQLGDDLRFTVKQNDAFYIHSFAKPGRNLTVPAPVPIRKGDRVSMLGDGRALDWTYANNALTVSVPASVSARGQHVWTFKIDWS